MTLPRTTYGLAAGLLIVGATAWGIGGARGLGVILGYSLGAFLAFVAVAWQAHWLRVRPARAARAQLEGFGIKLGAAVCFTALFRFVESLAPMVDWQAFLLAYAGAAVLVLPFATSDLSRLLASGSGSDLGSRRTA